MKFKIDENLPREIAPILREFGHDADTVEDEGLSGKADPVVFAKARDEGRFFVTQDLDFADLRKLRSVKEPGVLVLRLNQPSKCALIRQMHQFARHERMEEWAGCLVIGDEDTIRIRKLGK